MEWPDDQEAKRLEILSAIDSISGVISQNISYGEKEGHLHKDTSKAVHDAGLLGLKLPEVLGGAEADPFLQTEVISSLAQVDTSTAWCTMVCATNVGSCGAFLQEEGIEKVFKDRSHPVIAGVAMPFGEAVPTEGGYIVSGKWPYGSGIQASTWVTAGAKIRSQDHSSNPDVELRVLFKSSDVDVLDNWDVAGLKGSGSNDYSVDKIFVPLELTWNTNHEPLRGGPLYSIKRPAFVVFGHVGIAIGTAKTALKEAKLFANENARKLPGQSLISTQAHFQMQLGDMELRLRSLEAVSREMFNSIWETVKSGYFLSDVEQSRIRALGSWVTKQSLDIVTFAFQSAGGSALHSTNPLQRNFRDMYAAAQHFMVSPIHIESYGKVSSESQNSQSC